MTRVRAGVRLLRRSAGRLKARLGGDARNDAGVNTAEYAVGTLAAVAFAGLLYKVLTSDAIRSALTAIVQRALK